MAHPRKPTREPHLLRHVELPAGARPVPSEAAEPERRLYCAHYDRCLTTAVVKKWPGWACGECGAYQEIGHFEHRRDLIGLGDLLKVISDDGCKRRKMESALSDGETAIKVREKRRARRAAGLCVYCGEPALEGRQGCRRCYAQMVRRAQERRTA